MKRIATTALAILFCLSLTACSVINELKYAVSGDIIEPTEGFSQGEEKGTLIYKGNTYILASEINGSCDIDITKEDILLGYTSNFPIFPYSYYYARTDENPSFIVGGTNSYKIGTFVYLRKDIYSNDIVYVLRDGSFEFSFSSAFVKTDEVNYDVHISKKKYTKVAKVEFCMKEIPAIMVCKQIYLIDDTWYCVEVDAAYQLSEEFVRALTGNGTIH